MWVNGYSDDSFTTDPSYSIQYVGVNSYYFDFGYDIGTLPPPSTPVIVHYSVLWGCKLIDNDLQCNTSGALSDNFPKATFPNIPFPKSFSRIQMSRTRPFPEMSNIPNSNIPNPISWIPNSNIPNPDFPNPDIPNSIIPNLDFPNPDIPYLSGK